jgi:hypothetical protein
MFTAKDPTVNAVIEEPIAGPAAAIDFEKSISLIIKRVPSLDNSYGTFLSVV